MPDAVQLLPAFSFSRLCKPLGIFYAYFHTTPYAKTRNAQTNHRHLGNRPEPGPVRLVKGGRHAVQPPRSFIHRNGFDTT